MDNHVKQSPMQGMTGLWGGTQGALTSGGGADPVYIEQVFNTDVWRGNNTIGRDIVNGIDLSGEGGLAWVKKRNGAENHVLLDTARGANNFLMADSTNAAATTGGPITAFNSNGFTVDNNGYVNGSNDDYVSFTFRKAKGFFDVVTYTGSGSTQTLSHSLGSTPGMIIVKRLDTSTDWGVYHRGQVGYDGGTDAEDYRLRLNTTTYSNNDTYWGDTAPTATQFTVGDSHTEVNASGGNYVAYIFAHDEQSFGESADSSVIKCGNYTGNGSTNGPEVDVGWEPQWVIVKRTDGGTGLWLMADNMRGTFLGSNDPYLQANGTNAEYTSYDWIEFQSTGFKLTQTGVSLNSNGDNYVYTAIRRPDGFVGKPATAGTDLLALDSGSSSSNIPTFDSGFPVDFSFHRDPDATTNTLFGARLYGPKSGRINGNDSFSTESNFLWDSNSGWATSYDSGQRAWMWRRSNSFDCVAYRGNGSEHHNIPHKMNNTPQMIWIKRTDSSANWHVFHIGLNDGSAPQDRSLNLNNNQAFTTNAAFNNYLPNNEQFKVGLLNDTNANNGTFLAVLFGSVTGLSSVGSYDGNSSSQTITTGFQPRLLLVKKEDGNGSWFLFDTARGWGSGNDAYLQIDETIAQNGYYNLCNPISTGFTFSNAASPASGGSLNASGSHYIYYAHA